MPTWRDDRILELANQLTFSPTERRHEQLLAAIALMPGIDATRSYPWDFIYFRITSIQLRSHVDHAVAGQVLRADLASLIEFLSDTLSLKVEEASRDGDPVLELEDVTRRFSVSSKTIQRWRKRGLIALKYLYPDGRRRLGFHESAVGAFAQANKERVEKSAAFTQLSEEEKAHIIEMARRLVAHAPAAYPCSIKELSRQIARVVNRSPETIRYTIRRHDQEHPEAPVFEENTGPISEGRSAATQSAPGHTESVTAPGASPAPPAGDERLRKLRTLQIEYMANPLFDHPDAHNIILNVLPAEAMARAQATVKAGINARASDVYMARIPRDLPAFLQDIFGQPVMPQELETDAFRRMNYLKYRAARLREMLLEAPLFASAPPAEEVHGLLSQATALKNAILQSNLRVAVHVVRKHQRIDRPLMELVSDATIWLMRAIEKFDFARPVRFSTYAGYAIMKNFARDRVEQLTRRDTRLITGQEEILSAIKDRTEGELVAEHIDATSLQSDMLSVMEELPERERTLLKAHYGLDESKPAQSLSQIGDELGITKARVRQLETRALRRLRLLMEARREKLQRAAARPK